MKKLLRQLALVGTTIFGLASITMIVVLVAARFCMVIHSGGREKIQSNPLRNSPRVASLLNPSVSTFWLLVISRYRDLRQSRSRRVTLFPVTQLAAKKAAIFVYVILNGTWALIAYLLHKVWVPLRAILGVGVILGNLAAYTGVKLTAWAFWVIFIDNWLGGTLSQVPV